MLNVALGARWFSNKCPIAPASSMCYFFGGMPPSLCYPTLPNMRGRSNWHTLSMKEGSLFCCVVMRSTERGCFKSCSWCLWKVLDPPNCDASDHVLGVFGKLLTHWTEMLQIMFLVSSLEALDEEGGGLHGLWFHDIWTGGAKVLEYWMISSLKIKLNCN
jgi:hypothetical protein